MLHSFFQSLFSLKVLFLVSIITLVATPAFAEQYIQINGRVGDVIAGPSTNPVSDSGDSDKDNESDKKEKNQADFSAFPSMSPTVSVEATSLEGAVFSRVGDISQFTTPRPAFRGVTNIQNADISLIFSYGEFSLRSTAKANEAGEWNWTSSENFPNGNFQLTISATHPTEPSLQAKNSLEFHVLTTENTAHWSDQFLENASTVLFDLSVRIQDQYKVVVPGSNIIASISLVNFSARGSAVDTVVEYSIQDSNGVEVLNQKETVAVGTKVSFLKVFYTQPDMKEGVYTLVVKTPSRNTLAVASANFTLQGKGQLTLTSLGKVDYSTVLQGVGATATTFVFLCYFEFSRFLRVRKRIHMVNSKLLKKFF